MLAGLPLSAQKPRFAMRIFVACILISLATLFGRFWNERVPSGCEEWAVLAHDYEKRTRFSTFGGDCSIDMLRGKYTGLYVSGQRLQQGVSVCQGVVLAKGRKRN